MMITKLRTAVVVAALPLIGAVGCADLSVENPNAPDAERALATPGDVESLVAGAFNQAFRANNSYDGASMALSTVSFQHMSSAANVGMVFYSQIPRVDPVNDAAAQYYGQINVPWVRAYRALAATSQGLRAIEGDPALQAALGEERLLRARAYGRFVQGWAHSMIAMLYDQGYVLDETTPLDPDGLPDFDLVPYQDVMAAALGYFDEAIALANSGTFQVSGSWMTRTHSSAEIARIASSLKARARAAVARTPEERAAVDWAAVLTEIDAGITEPWNLDLDYAYDNWTGFDLFQIYSTLAGSWSFMTYMVAGMADQSGNYQRWLEQPVDSRMPEFGGEAGVDPVLIVTPDTRFPQGSTMAEQVANPGARYIVPANLGPQRSQPGRGTWRWSNYRINTNWQQARFWWLAEDLMPEITLAEMRLLAAEAHYRLGNRAQAASLVNESRTQYGLNATDADGTNTSCVPRLPNGECGDLFEMLKWEKRFETLGLGTFQAPWYFDGRGWGDLYAGTFLHFPVPALQLQLDGMSPYVPTEVAAPSVYNWPHQ